MNWEAKYRGARVSVRKRRRQRYTLTDLLDDFIGCEKPGELPFIVAGLLVGTSELFLAVSGTWNASGKALDRALRALDEPFADLIVMTHAMAVANANKAPFIKVVNSVLHRDGPLMEGYRAAGEVPGSG